MAHFVPPRSVAGTHSDAEAKVLNWLAGLSDEWHVLHSVGIANHEAKPWAEADVVLIGPASVLVLEIKGGRVERRQGLWGFRDRYGRITWKREGPYEQVGGAAAALRRHLLGSNVIDEATVVGWAVLLPDVQMPDAGAEAVVEATLDARGPWGPPEAALNRVCDYWRHRLGKQRRLGPRDRERVVEAVRGDFSLGPLVSLTAASVTEHQQRLTEEQLRIVTAAEQNPRLLVSGRAGTGKSILAVHLAERLQRLGSATALVVCNAALARRARTALAGSEVEVSTLDALFLRVLRQCGRFDTPSDHSEWAKARRAAIHLELDPAFDALVVDEAEDLDRDAVEFLGQLLKGGLGDGWWRVFRDHEQDIVRVGHGDDVWKRYAPAELHLTRNCRSTRQIITTTSMLSRIPLDLDAEVQGPNVQFSWWSTERGHDQELARVLRRKLDDFGPDNVLLVGRSRIAEPRRWRLVDELEVDLFDVRASDSGPFLATTSSVKGLEAHAVVVHGIDDLSTAEARQFLYTACSRATVDLTVLLHERVRRDFDAGGRWLGRQLSCPSHGVSSKAPRASYRQ